MADKQYREKCDVYGEDGDPVQGKQGADVRVDTEDDKGYRGLYVDGTFYPEDDIYSAKHDVSGNRVLVATSSRRIETGKYDKHGNPRALTLAIRPCSGNSGALHAALMGLDFDE